MSRLSIEPFFSTEAQETFMVGERVFDVSGPIHLRHQAREGTYLGTIDARPVVEWIMDDHMRVEYADFNEIRNLYR